MSKSNAMRPECRQVAGASGGHLPTGDDSFSPRHPFRTAHLTRVIIDQLERT